MCLTPSGLDGCSRYHFLSVPPLPRQGEKSDGTYPLIGCGQAMSAVYILVRCRAVPVFFHCRFSRRASDGSGTDCMRFILWCDAEGRMLLLQSLSALGMTPRSLASSFLFKPKKVLRLTVLVEVQIRKTAIR